MLPSNLFNYLSECSISRDRPTEGEKPHFSAAFYGDVSVPGYFSIGRE